MPRDSKCSKAFLKKALKVHVWQENATSCYEQMAAYWT